MNDIVQCVNPACAQPVEEGARFCPFCRTEQYEVEPLTDSFDPGPYTDGVSPSSFRYANPIPRSGKGETVLLRAGSQIWDHEDSEGGVLPGRPRPLLVADEQSTHLSHTDKRLDPQELLSRARSVLSAAGIPVDVELAPVAWISSPHTPRQRLVASLRDHPRADVKLVFGVDYLGRWASITQQVAFQPDPFEQSQAQRLRKLAWICIVLGVPLIFALGIGFLLIAAGLFLFWNARRAEEGHAAMQLERMRARLARTFAVDDMRLFCSAMQEVYQQIVDDIVQKGGEVVRVSGGGGGFFAAAGVTQAAPERRSDASSLEV